MSSHASEAEQAEPSAGSPATASRAECAGEFYLCLANAFRVPREPELVRALRDDLGADLEAIVGELGGTELTPTIRELRSQLAEIDDNSMALLQAYSALFLTPPLRAPLHAGLYCDGAPMGPTTLELERCYYHYDLDRAEAFGGMPDHLVLLLEFAAFLHFESASAHVEGEHERARQRLEEALMFLRRYVASWTDDWLDRMERAEVDSERAGVYRGLGRVLDTMVRGEIDRMSASAEEGPNALDDSSRGTQASEDVDNGTTGVESVAVTCRSCGQSLTLEGDLAVVYQRLERAGLSAAHLAICTDCRGGNKGMQPLKPVRVPGAGKR